MKLTDNQIARIQNINVACASVHLIGLISGIIYAHHTGGGFWRGVGWSIAGSLIVGVPSDLVALPFKNKIIKETEEPAHAFIPGTDKK